MWLVEMNQEERYCLAASACILLLQKNYPKREVCLVMFNAMLMYLIISGITLQNFYQSSTQIMLTDDIGPLMKYYAEKQALLTQTRRMLISSEFLEKGTIITPLLLFYLDLRLI